MNLGERIAAALAALSGQLGADVAANTAADASFRASTEATLTQLGQITTNLSNQVAAMQATLDAGGTVDPAAFAEIAATVASLNEAFPDAVVAPPEDDPAEDPIEDDGSEPVA